MIFSLATVIICPHVVESVWGGAIGGLRLCQKVRRYFRNNEKIIRFLHLCRGIAGLTSLDGGDPAGVTNLHDCRKFPRGQSAIVMATDLYLANRPVGQVQVCAGQVQLQGRCRTLKIAIIKSGKGTRATVICRMLPPAYTLINILKMHQSRKKWRETVIITLRRRRFGQCTTIWRESHGAIYLFVHIQPHRTGKFSSIRLYRN